MSEVNKSQLVSLAKKCYDEGQYTNVITYLKEAIRLEYPLKYDVRSLITTSFYLLKRPFFDTLNDLKHKSDKLNN